MKTRLTPRLYLQSHRTSDVAEQIVSRTWTWGALIAGGVRGRRSSSSASSAPWPTSSGRMSPSPRIPALWSSEGNATCEYYPRCKHKTWSRCWLMLVVDDRLTLNQHRLLPSVLLMCSRLIYHVLSIISLKLYIPKSSEAYDPCTTLKNQQGAKSK